MMEMFYIFCYYWLRIFSVVLLSNLSMAMLPYVVMMCCYCDIFIVLHFLFPFSFCGLVSVGLLGVKREENKL